MSSKAQLKMKVQKMNEEIDEAKDERKALREMDLFVLDNSLRESTVGQLRGHTIENKWKIYEQVRQNVRVIVPAILLILVLFFVREKYIIHFFTPPSPTVYQFWAILIVLLSDLFNNSSKETNAYYNFFGTR